MFPCSPLLTICHEVAVFRFKLAASEQVTQNSNESAFILKLNFILALL